MQASQPVQMPKHAQTAKTAINSLYVSETFLMPLVCSLFLLTAALPCKG